MSKIKKLFYSVFVAFIGIGVNPDIEARVTKEVAEATLPYLMEAARIPGDVHSATTKRANLSEYENTKIQAILNMIYTDEGQQQMVNWAVDDQKPNILAGDDGPFREEWPERSANTVNGDEKLFQILFPCKTGTFTSFANHTSRFGYIVLTKYESLKTKLLQWVIDGKKPAGKNDIIAVGNDILDCKIARIIFILDILDDLQQIKDVCPAIPDIALTVKSEYTCRPVSATIAYKEGDCVETLYRHLINIAIQDNENLQALHHSSLPVPLQKYYNKDLSTEDFEIKNTSESGSTCVKVHENWKHALKEIAEHGCFFGISSGSIVNLARTLHYIAFWNEDRITLTLRADSPLDETAAFIQSAMNKLANLEGRFTVKAFDIEDNLPWISTVVEVKDTKLKKLIKIGICNKRNVNFGHSEIISISTTDD